MLIRYRGGNGNFRNDPPAMCRRVDRMGMPAVSTALVGSMRKNAYNDADPAGDASFAGDFVATLPALHLSPLHTCRGRLPI